MRGSERHEREREGEGKAEGERERERERDVKTHDFFISSILQLLCVKCTLYIHDVSYILRVMKIIDVIRFKAFFTATTRGTQTHIHIAHLP